MRKTLAILLMAVVAVCALHASGKEESVESASGAVLRVFVSIPPQAYFVRRIAGDLVDVSVLVPDGRSPHTYEPTPRQVIDLSRADIYFSIGVDFEHAFLPRIKDNLPDLLISDSRAGIVLRDNEEGEHGDEIGDPHVWLGFDEVERVALNIETVLISVDPDGREAYESGYQDFMQEIGAIRTELLEKLAGVKGRTLFVYHPSFGYFADEFGLVQKAVETGGNEPSPRQLERIIEEAKSERVAAIIVQPQFSTAGADKIAEAIGAAVVPVDPLSEDWIGTMRALADAVESD